MNIESEESSSVSSALLSVASSSKGSAQAGGAIVAAPGLPLFTVASTYVQGGLLRASGCYPTVSGGPLPASEPPADPGAGMNLPFLVVLVPGPKARPRPRRASVSNEDAFIGRRPARKPATLQNTAQRARAKRCPHAANATRAATMSHGGVTASTRSDLDDISAVERDLRDRQEQFIRRERVYKMRLEELRKELAGLKNSSTYLMMSR